MSYPKSHGWSLRTHYAMTVVLFLLSEIVAVLAMGNGHGWSSRLLAYTMLNITAFLCVYAVVIARRAPAICLVLLVCWAAYCTILWFLLDTTYFLRQVHGVPLLALVGIAVSLVGGIVFGRAYIMGHRDPQS
jgi:hypothetical protein